MAQKKLGRPKRMDNPQRLVIHVPGELKRWLQVQAIEIGRDAGSIVSYALAEWREREAWQNKRRALRGIR